MRQPRDDVYQFLDRKNSVEDATVFTPSSWKNVSVKKNLQEPFRRGYPVRFAHRTLRFSAEAACDARRVPSDAVALKMNR
ncbi:MAG: hypothetical protein JNM63_12645 [Spirochaetia bacterium]|nr:hypothetical protein [Spirochaetia bacterium]